MSKKQDEGKADVRWYLVLTTIAVFFIIILPIILGCVYGWQLAIVLWVMSGILIGLFIHAIKYL
jgi:hypothetical protein